MTRVGYSSIAQSIGVNADIRDLSGRDKVNLMEDLMRATGLHEALFTKLSKDAQVEFEAIWKEMLERNWNKPAPTYAEKPMIY